MPTSSSLNPRKLRDLADDAFAFIDGPDVELEWQPKLVLRNMPSPHPMFGMVLVDSTS